LFCHHVVVDQSSAGCQERIPHVWIVLAFVGHQIIKANVNVQQIPHKVHEVDILGLDRSQSLVSELEDVLAKDRSK